MSAIELETAKVVRVACNQLEAQSKNTIEAMKKSATQFFEDLLEESTEQFRQDCQEIAQASASVVSTPASLRTAVADLQNLDQLLDNFAAKAETLFETELKPLIMAQFIRIAAEHEATFGSRLLELTEKSLEKFKSKAKQGRLSREFDCQSELAASFR